MNLDARLNEQLDALEAWMRGMAEENDTPPSLEMWREFVEGLVERADFLNRYVTPKVVRMLNGERLTLRSPVIPNGNGHSVMTPRDDAEGVSPPFTPAERPSLLS